MNAIVVPWPPKELSPNARPHHMAKARAFKQYKQAVCYRARGFECIGSPRVCVVPLTVQHRNRDLDNICGSLKAAIDGLTEAGWWEDDSDLCRLELVPTKPFTGWPEQSILICCEWQSVADGMYARIDELVDRINRRDDPISFLAMMTGRP